MEAIDYKHLYFIKGTSGVWSFKQQLSNNLALFVRFGTIDVYHQTKPENCSQLSAFPIPTNEGLLPLETVVDALFSDCENLNFIFDFDKLDVDQKLFLMTHYVPNYDSSNFKEFHMAKIYKVFNELYKALNRGKKVPEIEQQN